MFIIKLLKPRLILVLNLAHLLNLRLFIHYLRFHHLHRLIRLIFIARRDRHFLLLELCYLFLMPPAGLFVFNLEPLGLALLELKLLLRCFSTTVALLGEELLHLLPKFLIFLFLNLQLFLENLGFLTF